MRLLILGESHFRELARQAGLDFKTLDRVLDFFLAQGLVTKKSLGKGRETIYRPRRERLIQHLAPYIKRTITRMSGRPHSATLIGEDGRSYQIPVETWFKVYSFSDKPPAQDEWRRIVQRLWEQRSFPTEVVWHIEDRRGFPVKSRTGSDVIS